MKKIISKTKQILTTMLSLTIILTTIPQAKASVGSGEDNGGGGTFIFDAEHPTTVQCGSVSFTNTTYYNEKGEIVGVTIVEGGMIKVSYSGSYSSSTTTSGTISGRTAVAIACYGWGLGCRTITASEACR
nr:hypothetical protein [Pedobacter sp. ASV19]